jgi:hypothetical protein
VITGSVAGTISAASPAIAGIIGITTALALTGATYTVARKLPSVKKKRKKKKRKQKKQKRKTHGKMGVGID